MHYFTRQELWDQCLVWGSRKDMETFGKQGYSICEAATTASGKVCNQEVIDLHGGKSRWRECCLQASEDDGHHDVCMAASSEHYDDLFLTMMSGADTMTQAPCCLVNDDVDGRGRQRSLSPTCIFIKVMGNVAVCLDRYAKWIWSISEFGLLLARFLDGLGSVFTHGSNDLKNQSSHLMDSTRS